MDTCTLLTHSVTLHVPSPCSIKLTNAEGCPEHELPFQPLNFQHRTRHATQHSRTDKTRKEPTPHYRRGEDVVIDTSRLGRGKAAAARAANTLGAVEVASVSRWDAVRQQTELGWTIRLPWLALSRGKRRSKSSRRGKPSELCISLLSATANG